MSIPVTDLLPIALMRKHLRVDHEDDDVDDLGDDEVLLRDILMQTRRVPRIDDLDSDTACGIFEQDRGHRLRQPDAARRGGVAGKIADMHANSAITEPLPVRQVATVNGRCLS